MQVSVFSRRPTNCRRIIVATNIAETSLTVDGVVYVIDSGYVKQRQYNPSTGMYFLDVVRISRVQADQRAGRAGRTRLGKCYRLYSLEFYHEELLDATIPEIQRSSLAGTVLYLKSLDLPDINILNFDFLDPPSPESLQDALKQLFLIDAIDESGSITSIGRTMADHARKSLDWNTRIKIAAGIARGLMYLHYKARPTVIHNDMKSNNVLLSEDFNPKISDFGIGEIIPADEVSEEGSNENIAFDQVAVLKAREIYRFGVILFELISGRKQSVNNLHIREWVETTLHEDHGGCMKGCQTGPLNPVSSE